MELAHAKTYEECLNFFNTDPEKGLSLDQVKKYQDKYGPNGEWNILLVEYFISIYEWNCLILPLSRFYDGFFKSNFVPI